MKIETNIIFNFLIIRLRISFWSFWLIERFCDTENIHGFLLVQILQVDCKLNLLTKDYNFDSSFISDVRIDRKNI